MWTNCMDQAQTKFPSFSSETQLTIDDSGNIQKCPYCGAPTKLIQPKGDTYKCTNISCQKHWAP